MKEDTRLTVMVTKELFQKIKIHCVSNDISLKDYITSLILADMKKHAEK